MTKKEFFENVKNGVMTEEMQAYAANEIERMANSAEKRKAKKAQDNAEKNECLKVEVLSCLSNSDKPMTTPEIGQAIEHAWQGLTRIMAALVEDGRVKAEYQKSGKRIVTVYSIV